MENINNNEGNVLTNKVGKAEFKKFFCDYIAENLSGVIQILMEGLEYDRLRDQYRWNTEEMFGCGAECKYCEGNCYYPIFDIIKGIKKYGIDYKEVTKWIYDTIKRDFEKTANELANRLTHNLATDFYDLNFDIEYNAGDNEVILSVWYKNNCKGYMVSEIVSMWQHFDIGIADEVYINKQDILDGRRFVRVAHNGYVNNIYNFDDEEIKQNWITLGELKFSFCMDNNHILFCR